MTQTALSTTLVNSGRQRLPNYLRIIILVFCLALVVFLLIEFLPNITALIFGNNNDSTYSNLNLAFSYPKTWAFLSFSGPDFQSLVSGQTIEFLTPSNLSAIVAYGVENDSAPTSGFALIGAAVNYTALGNVTQVSAALGSFISGGVDTLITNITIGGCHGFEFQTFNVSDSVLSIAGSVSKPNMFLFTKAVCKNNVYEIEGEGVGSYYIGLLRGAFDTVQKSLDP